MNRKKLASIASAIAIALVTNITALADPTLNDKLSSQKEQLKKSQQEYDKASNQLEELEINIQKLDNEIGTLMIEIDGNKTQIGKTEEDIKVAKVELETAQKQTEGEKQLFNKRMRTLYMNGTGSYIQVFLNSTGISDLISKVEAVKSVVEFDNKIIAKLKEKEAIVDKKKADLENKKEKLLALKAENEQKLAKINENKKQLDVAAAELNNKKKQYAAQIAANDAQVKQTQRQLEEISRQAPAYVPSRGAAPISSNNIVAYSYNFLGTPYVWGGNGPDVFDCSGFTRYVYNHFGVSLPRVASDQQQVGTPVSRGDLQPGDLVFFGYPAHHVGIYVGNNCYVHAPQSGDVIKVSVLNSSEYSGARRVR